MSFWKPDNEEFYVGYLPEAPARNARIVRTTIFLLLAVCVFVSMLLAWKQRAFTASNFDYGIETRLEGYLFKEPYPHLVVNVGLRTDSLRITKSVLLVGFGKAGAQEVIVAMERKAQRNLDGAHVTLRGSLIFGDGISLLQVTAKDNSVETVEGTSSSSIRSLGTMVLEGEIVDPKCYFGVMKPGEGKPHRSCAIRCIAGGIPPMMKTRSGYFLLTGNSQQPTRQFVAPIVGDRIQLAGNVVEINGWKVLQLSELDLARISWISQAALWDDGITVCR